LSGGHFQALGDFAQTYVGLKALVNAGFDLLADTARAITAVNGDRARNACQKRLDLQEVIAKEGVDRFFFGSDFPPFTPAETAASLASFPFSEAERSMIEFGNAEKLLFKGEI
jgi:hypothetical protein